MCVCVCVSSLYHGVQEQWCNYWWSGRGAVSEELSQLCSYYWMAEIMGLAEVVVLLDVRVSRDDTYHGMLCGGR